MFTPEQALLIARTLKDVALVLGILGLCGLLVVVAEFLREESATGRDIDDERGGDAP